MSGAFEQVLSWTAAPAVQSFVLTVCVLIGSLLWIRSGLQSKDRKHQTNERIHQLEEQVVALNSVVAEYAVRETESLGKIEELRAALASANSEKLILQSSCAGQASRIVGLEAEFRASKRRDHDVLLQAAELRSELELANHQKAAAVTTCEDQAREHLGSKARVAELSVQVQHLRAELALADAPKT
eukprot:CAMPEP_0203910548 /NCGR_PEP_ID=MMETSP0359-20131031/51794_1 /ASSEMBLY_ACC=CAM_ASM_000338 /TAXON_ID=268821 /ORGANISM="Scrippsiella Hangoei, Strain SHTV-5" /LENGTH=185 /DNA_ID=CAMNT_0050836047 /DNA_START=25 /DNA_END=579 /DNA_ORIENTATION=+